MPFENARRLNGELGDPGEPGEPGQLPVILGADATSIFGLQFTMVSNRDNRSALIEAVPETAEEVPTQFEFETHPIAAGAEGARHRGMTGDIVVSEEFDTSAFAETGT